jgi:hypothetical protein
MQQDISRPPQGGLLDPGLVRADGWEIWQLRNEVGDLTAGVPPVPIPNTEVKPCRADCTARVTAWESRSSPA